MYFAAVGAAGALAAAVAGPAGAAFPDGVPGSSQVTLPGGSALRPDLDVSIDNVVVNPTPPHVVAQINPLFRAYSIGAADINRVQSHLRSLELRSAGGHDMVSWTLRNVTDHPVAFGWFSKEGRGGNGVLAAGASRTLDTHSSLVVARAFDQSWNPSPQLPTIGVSTHGRPVPATGPGPSTATTTGTTGTGPVAPGAGIAPGARGEAPSSPQASGGGQASGSGQTPGTGESTGGGQNLSTAKALGTGAPAQGTGSTSPVTSGTTPQGSPGQQGGTGTGTTAPATPITTNTIPFTG